MSGMAGVAVVAEIPCGLPGLTCSSWIGWMTVAMAFVIFVGSVYLILAAVMGRLMGYLVLSVAFWGWMILLSAVWAFGFWSQGLETPTHLGPQGRLEGWIVLGVAPDVTSPRFPVADQYPGDPWREPAEDDDEGTVTTAVQDFMAGRASEQLREEGVELEEDLEPTEFTVTEMKFAEEGGAELAAGRAFFSGGGPEVEFIAYFDQGDLPKYSYLFLIVSVIGFAVHLPFLDRAERKRRAVLTGGTAPPWRGPA
jgi:hypothetical protein